MSAKCRTCNQYKPAPQPGATWAGVCKIDGQKVTQGKTCGAWDGPSPDAIAAAACVSAKVDNAALRGAVAALVEVTMLIKSGRAGKALDAAEALRRRLAAYTGPADDGREAA